MNVTDFLNQLNQLYQFLDVEGSKVHNAHPLNYDAYGNSSRMPFKVCPACNSRLKGDHHVELVQKMFSYDDFPYLPVGSINAFEGDVTNVVGPHEIYNMLPTSIKENYLRTEVSVRVNHSNTSYNMARFEVYERILAHFSHSPYFSRDILEELFTTSHSNERPYIFLEEHLRTLYCGECSNDIFLVLQQNFYQEIIKGAFEMVPSNMQYFYTMIANAVAFSASFADNAYVDNGNAVKRTLSVYSFAPVLKPTSSL